MKCISITILALELGLLTSVSVNAQGLTPKLLDLNNHLWVNYSGEHAVTGRWGLHFDAQWRRANFGADWHQFLLRPALNVRLARNVMVSAGYVYARTYPYGDFPALAAFPEHRAYEQVQITRRVREMTVQHRSRLEQRFVRYANQPNWTYQNRFRHMLRLEMPLTDAEQTNRWYIPVYDEIFLGIPPNFGTRSFDQNRLAAGIGKAHGPIKFEAVYMNQILSQRNGRIFEFNSTLVFSIMSNAQLSSLWHR